MKNPIRSILDSHAATGYRQLTAYEQDLYQVYLAARETVERRIEAYVLEARSSLTGPRLVALGRELQQHFADFEARYRKRLRYATEGISEAFYRAAVADMSLGGPDVVESLNTSTLKQMIDDGYAHVAGATQKMSMTAVGSLRRISARVMREAAMTGETRYAVSKRLYIENGGPSFLFRARNGHMWDSGAYFKMLGRTLLHNNARETYLNACAANGSDLVAVSYSGHPCDACARWQGRLLSITGQSPYPTIETATADGLFHPNCTHRLVAVPPAIAQDKFDERGRPKPATPEDGPQPPPESPAGDDHGPVGDHPGFATEQGFTRSPIADQFVGKTRQEVYAELDKTKDRERFVAYDASGRLLDVHESGPTGGEVPAHMRAPDLTIIHNHPRGWNQAKNEITAYGSSFSIDDVMSTVALNWSRIEAVTPKRVYALARPQGGWGITTDELGSHIRRATTAVRKQLTARVAKGRLRQEVANSMHHDMIWKRVAKDCGFAYSKENRHVAR